MNLSMLKQVVLIVITLLILLFIAIAAFLAFAPEDRVHAVKHWYKLRKHDPVTHCLEYHKKSFLAPQSARFVEGSIVGDINDDFFEMKISGLTRGGGRSSVEVDCIGMPGDLQSYAYNKEFIFRHNTLRGLKIENEKMRRQIEEMDQRRSSPY